MKNSTRLAFRNALDRVNSPQDFDTILGQMGLQRSARHNRRRALAWAGFFALGAVVGSATGVFFAPKRGKELRDQVREKLPSRNSTSIPNQEQIYEQFN